LLPVVFVVELVLGALDEPLDELGALDDPLDDPLDELELLGALGLLCTP
jgi:hypothetical protein